MVEVDGGHHWEDGQRERDQQREEELRRLGFVVVRYSNLDVLERLEVVVEDVARRVAEWMGNPP